MTLLEKDIIMVGPYIFLLLVSFVLGGPVFDDYDDFDNVAEDHDYYIYYDYCWDYSDYYEYCEDGFCVPSSIYVSYEAEKQIEGTNLTTMDYEYFDVTSKSAGESCAGPSMSVKVPKLYELYYSCGCLLSIRDF